MRERVRHPVLAQIGSNNRQAGVVLQVNLRVRRSQRHTAGIEKMTVAVDEVGRSQRFVRQLRVIAAVERLVEQPMRRAIAKPDAAVMVETGGRLAAADRSGGVRIGAEIPGLVEEDIRRMPDPTAL